MSQEGQPLQYQPDPGPPVEQVRLGNQTLELDPDTARIVREQFEALAGQYQAGLENLRQNYERQVLQSVGTYRPMPDVPTGLEVPDPDLLFSNKGAWTEEFAGRLEQRLQGLRAENLQQAQGVVSAVQQELQRRDLAQAAQGRHDAVMEEMLERRGLGDHTLVVQAVYAREYDKLRNLPLELGIDRIGQIAEEEIGKIRAGESWTMGAAPTQTGVAARPPAKMLRSARRAAAPVAAAAPAAPPGGYEPHGGLGSMGKIIRQRQAQLLGISAA
jgi:hypothetical protein